MPHNAPLQNGALWVRDWCTIGFMLPVYAEHIAPGWENGLKTTIAAQS